MSNKFVFKIIVTNSKIALLSIFFCLLLTNITAQNKAKNKTQKEAEKKKEQLRIEREEAKIAKEKAGREHQLSIQGKKTQKRMKANLKMSNKYYNKKLRKTKILKFFKKKRKTKVKK